MPRDPSHVLWKRVALGGAERTPNARGANMRVGLFVGVLQLFSKFGIISST